jgi:hypothetical protein
MLAVALVEPPGPDAVRRTAKVPAVVNVWLGLCDVEDVPSPKSHAQDVGAPLEVSVNATATGTVPEVVDDVNDATGAGGRDVPARVSEYQYLVVPSVAARTTDPEVSSIGALAVVALFMVADAESRSTGVPLPATKVGADIVAVFW